MLGRKTLPSEGLFRFIRDFRGPQFDFRPEGPQQASLGHSEVRW